MVLEEVDERVVVLDGAAGDATTPLGSVVVNGSPDGGIRPKLVPYPCPSSIIPFGPRVSVKSVSTVPTVKIRSSTRRTRKVVVGSVPLPRPSQSLSPFRPWVSDRSGDDSRVFSRVCLKSSSLTSHPCDCPFHAGTRSAPCDVTRPVRWSEVKTSVSGNKSTLQSSPGPKWVPKSFRDTGSGRADSVRRPGDRSDPDTNAVVNPSPEEPCDGTFIPADPTSPRGPPTHPMQTGVPRRNNPLCSDPSGPPNFDRYRGR